ncbi:MAG: ABC transporter ATP-binding protein [Promethearchaeota archaeon]
MGLIEVRDLSKTFYSKDTHEINVLSNVSFSVQKGECFVVIGPNGSGKTTLLRILGLLENPTGGNFLYNGMELSHLSRKNKVNFRRKFSYVRQKPVVRNTSVFNNIAYGLRVRGIKYENFLEKVNSIIETVGLKGMERKNARSLSGGEMQRVAIAMNFIISPEIYLLDEVSANLDQMNHKLLDDFIKKIKQDKDKTIIMSTHDRFEAIKYADRIAVLKNGTISQIGTPDEIFKSPKDEFTAHFVGYENIFIGNAHLDKKTGLNHIKINDFSIIASDQREGEVKVCIHPESVIIAKNPPENVSSLNLFKGEVEEVRELGNICHVIVNCGSKQFLSTITQVSRDKLDLKPNTEVFINFKATDVKCL